MTVSVYGLDKTFRAGGNYATTTSQYEPVFLSAANTVSTANTSTNVFLGVLQNKPASGSSANVRILGTTKIRIDASVTAGDLIGFGASAAVSIINTAVTTTARQSVIGIALETGSTNTIIEVLIQPFHHSVA